MSAAWTTACSRNERADGRIPGWWRLRTAVNSRRCRRGDGVGSLKSCKTSKEDLRRETYRTAVGGDRGADRPTAGRGGGREPARVVVGAREAGRAVDHPARGRG